MTCKVLQNLKALQKRHKQHFLEKIKELGQLPEGTNICTIEVVGLYSNIQNDEKPCFPKRFWTAGLTNISQQTLW